MDTDTATMTWETVLAGEKQKDYFQSILKYLTQQKTKRKTIYPPQSDIFNALKLTPYEGVKVVILGQDPYHGHNQAHGLCFSVKHGVKPPPSLVNVYKELQDDIGFEPPEHGCLEKWAEQGILLLNSTLTVESHNPGSHSHIGWQQFTDKVIETLNDHPQGIVFLLWGAHAQRKGEMINTEKHRVLKSTHPSPFSAHKGFLGCHHFSKTNELLKEMGREPVDWSLQLKDPKK